MLKGQDPFASSADITSASALHRSSTPSTAVASSSGTGEVEQAFQKSLRARAERMGLSPQQLLMLLTTSLDTSDTPFDGDAGSVRSGTISARWRETSEYAPSETVYSDVGTIPSSTGALGRRGSNARLSQSLPS
ncbi:hypothetical protein BKA62DRAFT_712144 [Auriculariales sp. MPI-PUGE-AT-0066]|nr:hypothetical protein BKA62DRAFT_712144 [Auriculariales sp. MPI-PUGE-AT-0066]